MKIKSRLKTDSASFQWIKKTAQLKSLALRKTESFETAVQPIPLEIGLMLTNRCNLRCGHCFQWNKQGYIRTGSVQEKKQELEIEIIERVLKETQTAGSRVYVWGGEPLLYKAWEPFIQLLDSAGRDAVICTNGLLLDEKLESLLRMRKSPHLLISLDGLQKAHDAIRGRGTFDQLIKNLKVLAPLVKAGTYKGKISVNLVINGANIRQLYRLASFCEELSIIHTLYLGFPWYISARTAKAMDSYFHANFSFLPRANSPAQASWYAYDYHISENERLPLEQELKKISGREWAVRIRMRPELEPSEIKGYINGTVIPAENRSRCLALSNRMDILADGSVCSCKHFAEFTVANINSGSLTGIWRSEKFNSIRKIINNGLMPVCAACILLYQNGA